MPNERNKNSHHIVINDRTGMPAIDTGKDLSRKEMIDMIKGDTSREATIIRRSLTPKNSPWRKTRRTVVR